jgi:hypothetical protein
MVCAEQRKTQRRSLKLKAFEAFVDVTAELRMVALELAIRIELRLNPDESEHTSLRLNLVFMRADAQGHRVKYYEMELENVLIGAVVPSILPGQILTKYVSLNMARSGGSTHSRRLVGAQAGTLQVAGTCQQIGSANSCFHSKVC